MIPKLRQEKIKETISKQKGQDYPCSNQIVCRAIVLKNRHRIEDFEKTHPCFVCYRTDGFGNKKYINAKTEEIYRTVFATQSARGFRYYKAIIDSTVDEDIFNLVIAPSLTHYCCSVEFFD